MSVGQLTVKLDLDGREFTTKLSVARGDLQAFARNLGVSGAALDGHQRKVRTWGGAIRDTVIVLSLFRQALQNVQDVLFALPRSIIRANADMERMRYLMAGMSTETKTLEENLRAADGVIDSIFRTAGRSPFDVSSITDTFVKMKAGGLDPLNGAMQSLLDGVAKFGGSSQALQRASVAIQQMGGKGVISLEELRQQLGESVPNAIAVMARGLDQTVGDLVAKIAKGTVEAKSALQAFFFQMDLEARGAASLIADTWDGIVGRMKTRWIELANEMGDTGAFEQAKAVLKSVVDDVMTDPALIRDLREIGDAIGDTIRTLREYAPVIRTVFGEIVQSAELLVAFFVATRFRDNLTNAWDSMVTGARAATAAIQSTNVSIRQSAVTAWAAYRREIAVTQAALYTFNRAQFATAAGAAQAARGQAILVASLRQTAIAAAAAGAAMRGMMVAMAGVIARGAGAIMAFLGGPIGLAITAGWALYEVWDRLVGQHRRLREELARGSTSILTEEELEKARAALAQAKGELADLEEARKNRGRGYDLAIDQQVAPLRDQIKAIQEEIDRAPVRIQQGLADRYFEQASQAVTNTLISARSSLANAILKAQEEASELPAGERSAHIGKARQAAEAELRAASERAWTAQLEAEKEEIRRLEQQRSAGASGLDNKIAARRRALLRLKEELVSVREGADLLERGSLKLLDGDKDKPVKKTALEKYLDAIKVKLADSRARIEDEGRELAKVEARIASGQFKGTAEQLAAARKMAAEQDKLAVTIKERTAAQNTLNRALERAKDLEAGSARRVEVARNENPYAQAAASIIAYRDQAREMASEIQKLFSKGLIPAERVDEARKAIDSLTRSAAQFDASAIEATFKKMRNDIREYEESWMSAADAARASIGRQREQFEEYIAGLGELSPEFQEVVAAHRKMLDDMERDQTDSFATMMKDWRRNSLTISDIWAEAFDGMSDKLTDFIVKGKADWSSFFQDLASMVVKSQLQNLIGQIFGNFSFGGSGSTGAPTGMTDYSSGYNTAVYSAMGNVVTAQGPLALKKYAKGGVAYRPQVSIFGEGSQPEAYVPLPDGRTIPVTLKDSMTPKSAQNDGDVNVQVNLLNQSGQPVQAEQRDQRFDGEKYIINVMLKSLTHPGPVRDAVRSI